jgi:HSP20 family protein
MRFIHYHNSPTYQAPVRFNNLRDEIDRLFDAAFQAPTARAFFHPAENDFPVDLYQDKNAYIVRAELPGFRKEDVSVEVEDAVLTVTGHRRSEAKESEIQSATQEQKISRSITLPDDVSPDKIEARYENGVLTVTVPKREEIKPRQISIDVK